MSIRTEAEGRADAPMEGLKPVSDSTSNFLSRMGVNIKLVAPMALRSKNVSYWRILGIYSRMLIIFFRGKSKTSNIRLHKNRDNIILGKVINLDHWITEPPKVATTSSPQL